MDIVESRYEVTVEKLIAILTAGLESGELREDYVVKMHSDAGFPECVRHIEVYNSVAPKKAVCVIFSNNGVL